MSLTIKLKDTHDCLDFFNYQSPEQIKRLLIVNKNYHEIDGFLDFIKAPFYNKKYLINQILFNSLSDLEEEGHAHSKEVPIEIGTAQFKQRWYVKRGNLSKEDNRESSLFDFLKKRTPAFQRY
jgi:hypothetical protein